MKQYFFPNSVVPKALSADMGDWLELRTQHFMQYVFIPETSGAVNLRVKTANDAHIVLTNGPHESTHLTEIFIGVNNTRTIIRRDRRSPDKAEAETLRILNENEHIAFWIRWHNHEVSVGLKDNPAFITFLDPNPHPITYFGVRTVPVGHWEIEVSPLLFRTLPVKPLKGGHLRWVTKTRDDELPHDAVIGGYENGETLYIGRAATRPPLLIPGKYVPSKQCVIVGWSRVLTEHYTCEILCGYNAAWLKTRSDCIPPHAFPGGFELTTMPYCIGRARVGGNLIPGKVLGPHKLCYLPYRNTEIDMLSYEILVEPDKLPNAVVWRSKSDRSLPPPPEYFHDNDDVDSWPSDPED